MFLLVQKRKKAYDQETLPTLTLSQRSCEAGEEDVREKRYLKEITL